MASKYWIKLYHEILEDPKMGRLPDNLWRRVIELFLLAGELDNEGELLDTEGIAWKLRLSCNETLHQELQALQQCNIVTLLDNGNWFVTHFSKRQEAVEVAERVRKFRERQKKKPVEPPKDEPLPDVTKRYTDIDTDTDTDKESLPKGNGDKSPVAKSPEPQKEVSQSPGPKTLVKDKFLELTNLTWPTRKSDEKHWWSGFGEILSICNKDPARATVVMTEVIAYMQDHHLAISGPGSLVKLCRSVMAGQKLNGANQNGRTNHHQTSITGLRGENSQIEKRANPKTGRTYYWDRKRKCEVPGPDG
jgi:hypothetical protein